MPFSRYQIRNEYSLADPELYKAADKDDPEALLEGVAMAGLVGVLRQLGDLAEFAAEIFHDLHEEVMVTATRGHGLLVRVQQLESDFPSIERAFLSQTGHSAFFSSSGVGWHPNLRTEQNLITRGDLPRFVMDSYEECRAPPRLFLLDKFDIAGAGACLKRYTDPSFYKVEASSYEMMSAEAQRDKKTRKTKPSHVKLHQLLLEERIQNGACEPARRVKLKKRKSKFPFDMENGKGYMEKLLSSPPEDKLVHEVPLRSHTDSSGEPGLETFEISMVDPPLGLTTQNRSPYESQSVDKMVSREHMDDVPENITERLVLEMPTSSIRFQVGGAHSELEDEEVEEKHISNNGIGDGYESDVASEADDYEDALATMESEIETDAELRANSNPSNPSIKQEMSSDANVEQLQSQSSGSQSASDDESSPIRKKITSFSYSDDTTTTSIDSSQAFACIEIPFRPRVSATDAALPVDQEANFEKSTKDSDFSEMPSNNRVDVNSPKKTEEFPIDPEAIVASTSEPCEQDKDDSNSNSTLVIPHAEEQPFGPFLVELDICDADMKPNEAKINGDTKAAEEQLTDALIECKSDSLEAGVSYSGEDETEFKDRKTVSVESESKVATSAAFDPADYSNGDDNLSNPEEKTELKDREPESVTSETKDVDSNESEDLSTCENLELDGKEVEFINSEAEAEAVTFAVEKNEENGLSTAELGINESGVVQTSNESIEKKELSEISVISPELDSFPSYDDSNIQFHYGIHSSSSATFSELNENDVYNPSTKKESTESGEEESSEQPVISVEKNEENGLSTAELVINESGVVQTSNESVEKKELSEISVISPELDSFPSYDHSNIQFHYGIHSSSSATFSELNENDVYNPSTKKESTESGEEESSEQPVISPELNSVLSASYDHTNIQDLDSIPTSSLAISGDVNENDVVDPSANLKILQDETLFVTEKIDQNGPQTDVSPDLDLQPGDHELIDQSNAQFLESASNSPVLKSFEQHVESESLNQVDHIEKLENASSILTDSVFVEEKVDQPHMPSFLHLESVDSQENVDHGTPFDAHSEPNLVNHESYCSEKVKEFQDPVESTTSVIETSESLVPVSEEPSVLNLPQSSSHINLSDQIEYPSAPVFSGYNMLPQLAPINLEEMPPLPPLPPMQWRMGKPQNASLISKPDSGQHEINPFPSNFPQIESHPSLDPDKKAANEKAEYEALPTESSSHTEEDGNSIVSSEVKISEQVPQPPSNGDRSQNVSTSGREICWPSTGSSLPPADDGRPNGIRPMKVQRSRTPLIDAVAAHDKSKLRKVSERAMPLIPKEEEKDTLLEQIRAKSFNLKPAVQTRPSIQGPTTNLRVAAILEKANAIRQAFAGSDDDDDDEDGDDGWSDS
ncbi:hypothetical protein Ccrd_003044 [Cynara cardunculus var. scolymus]|uniref:Protein SCAR n=1 Tax=Cynara cardunculus var. scolymus TaxID=59895 RepID=A0A103XQ79_CYNCS|nr:hypothetical protein Ccrd_003044 [Cynara cardunculus var. scolymus]